MLGKTKITTRCHLTFCGCNTSPLIRAPFFCCFTRCFLKDTQVNVVDGDGRRPLTLSAMENQLPCAVHLLEAPRCMRVEGVSSNTPWEQNQLWMEKVASLIKAKCFSISPDIWEGTWNLIVFHWTDISKFLRNIALTISWWQTFTSTSFSKIGTWDVQK